MNKLRYINDLIPPIISRVIKRKKFALLIINKHLQETSININHKKKVIFIHNPKAGGTSIKQAFGLADAKFGADHRTPHHFIHPKTWDSYYTFAVVRHPIDRFVSSYNYHTSAAYTGGYLKRYPNLHDLTPLEYFEIMQNEPFAIIPQHQYTVHRFSDTPIDKVCRFENLNHDISEILESFGDTTLSIPHLNKGSTSKKKSVLDAKTEAILTKYYKEDFKIFKYAPSNLTNLLPYE